MSQAPTAPDALRIEDLSIDYGGPRPAVREVSVRVRRGEIVGVIGESGSGKSSLAYAAMGLLPASARVRARALEVAGRDVVGLDEAGWCGVRGALASMVFQEPMSALNPCQRVGRQIGEVLRIHGGLDRRAADARAVELLEEVRIPDPRRRARYFPHQLSGGQRQRVVIAIAVAAAPPLLVADEPTTALDVTVQAQILDLIRDLRARTGIGVLLISHDLGVIGGMCDRVLVMHGGRVVESGRAARVLREPRHPYTRALLRSVPRPGIAPRQPLATVPPAHEFAAAPDEHQEDA